MTGVEERLRQVRARIAQVAERVGRDPSTVTLIGATKGVEAARIQAAMAAGLGDFGENRIQEALPKIAAVPEPRWHLIGHLQRNKVRAAARAFAMIHSIDSFRIAEAVDRSVEFGQRMPVLIEVNVASEATKFGCAPGAVEDMVRAMRALQHVEPVGLMTVAPLVDQAEQARPVFQQLRRLRDRLQAGAGGKDFQELSMGMSGDFEVAVEEGATMVRIGRAIFGERTPAGHGRGQVQGGRREREV